jgi:hypothetical protein
MSQMICCYENNTGSSQTAGFVYLLYVSATPFKPLSLKPLDSA